MRRTNTQTAPVTDKRERLRRVANVLGEMTSNILDDKLSKRTTTIASPIPGLDLWDLLAARDACLESAKPEKPTKGKNAQKYFALAVLDQILAAGGMPYTNRLHALSLCAVRATNVERLKKALAPHRSTAQRYWNNAAADDKAFFILGAIGPLLTEEARALMSPALNKPRRAATKQRQHQDRRRSKLPDKK
jgi:hypothetical protein